jgi:ATP-binding cassette subfamily C protein CydD
VVALAVLSALLTVAFAYNLSHFIAGIFISHLNPSGPLSNLLWLALAAGLGRAALLWAQEWLGSFAAARAKRELRSKVLLGVTKLGPQWLAKRKTSDVALLVTTQLDALDSYFSKFLPQLVFTCLVTPTLTAIIFGQDLFSGLAVVVTLPLIPLFMVIIGWATQAAQEKQLESSRQLAGHFTEVLRGLTTLRVFGRLKHQPAAIEESSDRYRISTMKVLRLSFLSGFALELVASLSVALVAVSIGIRLIDGSIGLATGLFVLLLAPEVYLPLRNVGAQFHASSEGVAASVAALDIISEAADASVAKAPSGTADQPRLESLVRAGEIVWLRGPSGSGKTTLLNKLRSQTDKSLISWVPQGVGLLPGSVEQNIVGPGVATDLQALRKAVRLAALDDVTLSAQVGEASTGLSGGQAQRVALARAFYRALTKPVTYLLLDEPLSALDASRAHDVNQAIQHFAQAGIGVLVVSHQQVPEATRVFEVADV